MNTMTYSNEAALIHNEIEQRGITQLCHFTTLNNVCSIFKMGGLYSQRTLLAAGVAVDIQDHSRFEGRGYINLSISKPNFKLWTSFVVKDDEKEWCMLRIRPSVCERAGVVFTTANAASNFVCIYGRGSGVDGFRALFADQVADTKGMLDRVSNKSRYLPTSSQAEVLCPEPIALADVLQVVVMDEAAKERLMRKGIPHERIRVDFWSFPRELRKDVVYNPFEFF